MDISIDKDDFFLFAHTFSKSNFKGEIKIKLINHYNIDFKSIETIYIEEDNFLIPHKLKRIKNQKKNNLTFIIDDIDTESKAQQLNSKKCFLPKKFLPERKGIDFYSFQVKNYLVTLKNKKKIGRVLEILEKPYQSLMIVETNSKEILIPIHEDIILSVNHVKKEIQVELPKKFLDLF
tara:strand:+ start:5107 stop:5640 length:534 start_codon:yes stop_codon:yes gene_type:complete